MCINTTKAGKWTGSGIIRLTFFVSILSLTVVVTVKDVPKQEDALRGCGCLGLSIRFLHLLLQLFFEQR